jgi:hypothetical protein
MTEDLPDAGPAPGIDYPTPDDIMDEHREVDGVCVIDGIRWPCAAWVDAREAWDAGIDYPIDRRDMMNKCDDACTADCGTCKGFGADFPPKIGQYVSGQEWADGKLHVVAGHMTYYGFGEAKLIAIDGTRHTVSMVSIRPVCRA